MCSGPRHRKRNWLNKMSSQLQVDEMYSGGGGHDSKPYYLTTVVKCEPIDDEEDLAAAAAAAADYDAAAGFNPAAGEGFEAAGVRCRSYDRAEVVHRVYEAARVGGRAGVGGQSFGGEGGRGCVDDAVDDSQSNDSRSVDQSLVNDGSGFSGSRVEGLTPAGQDPNELQRFNSGTLITSIMIFSTLMFELITLRRPGEIM